ncbi:arylalkylamine N-acetyltransferase 1-like isoform X1 [Lycorma delicatula]|uniref:arylalkylamine N-acetyltransferase 1-like isoform X1 n=2 Tax=Lycorma delicatula TaxID=130591 RepID=UPI003F5118FB
MEISTSLLTQPPHHHHLNSLNVHYGSSSTKTNVRGSSTDMQDEQENTSPYTISKISNRDADRVIDFLRRFFFKDEPLNVAVGLLDDPNSNCLELEQYCINSIPDGASLMAQNNAGDIVGVCLNGIDVRGGTKASEEVNVADEECSNPKFKKILNLLSVVGKQSDVFGQFPNIDKVLEVRILSVDDNYRGKGIAKSLIERSKSLGQEIGIPMIRVDCTSAFSAMAVAHLGFQCIYTLQYAEYLDNNGEPIFNPPPPHSCVKTFVYPLNNV